MIKWALVFLSMAELGEKSRKKMITQYTVSKIDSTWSLACMAEREQVEKFLLIDPPAMIPTLSPVQDL